MNLKQFGIPDLVLGRKHSIGAAVSPIVRCYTRYQ
jgi:hypothetical protein